MTDNKIPMPASPTDPNAHGIYDSPVYTLTGEYKRPQGTQPPQDKHTDAKPSPAEKKKTDARNMMRFTFVHPNKTVTKVQVPIIRNPQTNEVEYVYLVDMVMALCGVSRKQAKGAIDTYFSSRTRRSLREVCTCLTPP